MCDVVPFPVSVAPAALSRWRCPAERQSELSPANTHTHTHTHTFNTHDSSSCDQLCVALVFTSFLFSLLSTFLLRGTSFLLQTQTDTETSSRFHRIIEWTCCNVVDKSFNFSTCRAAQETNIYWSNESFGCFCSETMQEQGRFPSPVVSISFLSLHSSKCLIFYFVLLSLCCYQTWVSPVRITEGLSFPLWIKLSRVSARSSLIDLQI